MHPPESLDEEVPTRLRAANLRVTQPRPLIYRLLRELGGHLSAGDIVKELAARDQELPRMTIYNVLGDLQNAGLVMIADAGPGRTLYEASEEWHHHYVCRQCQRVIDVPCIEAKKPCLQPPTGIPGTVDEAQVIFRGICFECAQTSESDTSDSLSESIDSPGTGLEADE